MDNTIKRAEARFIVLQFSYMKKITPLVVGNWKLNPGTAAEARVLARGVTKLAKRSGEAASIIIAPPVLFVPEIATVLSKSTVSLAVQDIHYEERGACTGAISASLLLPYHVTHSIVGHSERRALGETDVQVQKKVLALLKRRLVPIVCIGERERDAQGNFYSFIENQLRSLASGLTAAQIQKVIIAYEPIWAIGTGVTPTAEDVKEMQLFIMSVCTKLYDRKIAEKIRLIYGGSVKAHNAAELYAQSGMTGFLVGGASLDSTEFGAIVAAVS